jgi:class 3 adenylate cyclase
MWLQTSEGEAEAPSSQKSDALAREGPPNCLCAHETRTVCWRKADSNLWSADCRFKEDLRLRLGIATGLAVVGDLIGEGAA